MTHKLPVRDHLRNSDLYSSPAETVPGPEWKIRLLRQYAIQKQLKSFLQESKGSLKWLVYAGIPGACIVLGFAAYFGFLDPGGWIRSVVPAFGMREALMLLAVVNIWVLVTRRRTFAGM